MTREAVQAYIHVLLGDPNFEESMKVVFNDRVESVTKELRSNAFAGETVKAAVCEGKLQAYENVLRDMQRFASKV